MNRAESSPISLSLTDQSSLIKKQLILNRHKDNTEATFSAVSLTQTKSNLYKQSASLNCLGDSSYLKGKESTTAIHNFVINHGPEEKQQGMIIKKVMFKSKAKVTKGTVKKFKLLGRRLEEQKRLKSLTFFG